MESYIVHWLKGSLEIGKRWYEISKQLLDEEHKGGSSNDS